MPAVPPHARRRRAAGALVVALLVLAPGLALAHPGDGRPHVQSFQEIRDVSVETTPTTAEFTLRRPTQPLADVIRFTFDGASGRADYEYRGEGADPDTAFGFTVRLDTIVEYTDRNRNGHYDAGADALAREYPFRTMRWNVSETAPLYVGRELAQKREAPHVIANGSFGVGGMVRVQMYASGHQVETGAARMHPQDVKMVWNVASFPFTRENTRFAILARVVTDAGVEVLEERNEDGVPTGVVLRAPGRMGFFDWADYALANGTNEPVQRVPVLAHVGDRLREPEEAGTDERPIVFSYPRADFLLSHDPTMGVEYAPPGKPPLLGFSPWWLLLAAFAGSASGGGWWWYAKKGGRDHLRLWWLERRWGR